MRMIAARIAQTFARLIAAYLIIVLLFSIFQRKLIYRVSDERPQIPEENYLQGIEEVELAAADGTRLDAWWWPGASTHTIVVLNGNAGNRSHRVDWMAPLHAVGFSIFFLEYRGFGGNEGSPTERGLYLDAQAAVDWIHEQDVQSLTVIAESLGTGVGVEIASKNDLDAVVLQSSYDSLVHVASNQFWWAPVGLLLRDRFESIEKIDSVHEPLLFIHGDRDEVIPWSAGRRLYKRANQSKTWVTIEGAGHVVTSARPNVYFDTLVSWLNTTLDREG